MNENDNDNDNGPRHHAVRLNAMFETVKLPAGVTDLNTGLTDVNTDDFSHFDFSDLDLEFLKVMEKREKKRWLVRRVRNEK
jgi:hypothetical protein